VSILRGLSCTQSSSRRASGNYCFGNQIVFDPRQRLTAARRHWRSVANRRLRQQVADECRLRDASSVTAAFAVFCCIVDGAASSMPSPPAVDVIADKLRPQRGWIA
jgi:hypothetical protein